MGEAVVKKYQEDEIILHQGDSEKNLYKVLTGKVILYVNYGLEDEYLMGVLSFPQCFGEMSVLIGEPSSYTAVALMETTVLKVPEDNFETFIKGDHNNAMSIMKTMAKNLSLANMNIKMLVDELAHVSEPSANQSREENKYITRKEYTCPLCGKKFWDECFTKPEEKADSSQEAEELPDYRWYEIITCPDCFFSVTEKYFVKNVKFDKALFEPALEKLRNELKLKFKVKRDLEHVLCRYRLALVCACGLPKSLYMKVHLLDRLCELYEENDDAENLRQTRKEEADICMEIFQKMELAPKQQQKLCMKMAELSYYLEDADGARRWIKKLYQDGVKEDEYSEAARKILHELRGE